MVNVHIEIFVRHLAVGGHQAYLTLRLELERMTVLYDRMKAAHEHDPRFIDDLVALRDVRDCL